MLERSAFSRLLSVVLLLSGASSAQPRYDEPGPYSHDYREDDIEGVYETMDDSRIYYPWVSGSVPPTAVPCPVIVLGHGFMMGIDRYYSYAEHMASWGYVVVMPTFSNPFPTPEHYTRARSMVDAAEYVASLGSTPGDPLEDKVNADAWGFCGHSMGGGCAFLAADTFDLSGTLRVAVSFCSPQTTPPVDPGSLDIPKLVLCGSIDTIAPWEDVREAMWAGTPAPGAFAVIDGANHGYCMDYSYFWENGGQATISRDEQQRVIRLYMTAYMERYLHGDTSPWNYSFCYGDSILQTPVMDSVEVLLETGVDLSASPVRPASDSPILGAAPNPSSGLTVIELGGTGASAALSIVDISGRTVRTLPAPSGGGDGASVTWDGLDAAGYPVPPGLYIVVLQTPSERHAHPLLRVRSRP